MSRLRVFLTIHDQQAFRPWPSWTRQGRYDRMTDTTCKLTGEAPTNMRDFVNLHAAEFKQREPAHS